MDHQLQQLFRFGLKFQGFLMCFNRHGTCFLLIDIRRCDCHCYPDRLKRTPGDKTLHLTWGREKAFQAKISTACIIF